jgi:glycosyltransferase involved in cell wall biosynthesis
MVVSTRYIPRTTNSKPRAITNHMPQTTNHELATRDKPLATGGLKLLIVTGIFPPDIGGPATYVPVIGSELVKRGHEVTVVTLSDTLDHDDRSYVFRVHRMRRSLFKPLRFLLTVMRILREGRHAQVLYINGLYFEAVVANSFLRKPLVQKIVGDWAWERSINRGWVKDGFEEFQRSRYSLKVEALKILRNFFLRRADIVIVPSHYLARWIGSWGMSEKISVIYNSVELPVSSPSSIPLSTRIKIVTVGRLVPWKKVHDLIRSIADFNDVGLVIVGEGPERRRLEEHARVNKLTDRVYFAGQRSQEETVSLMAACDLFVLNSTYEGFPHVLMEAMNIGLPVVATAVGGTPELVRDGENGVLISPNADGALSEILRKLLFSSAEREQLAAGAKRTAEEFRHSNMVKETEDVLQAFAVFAG